MNYNRDAQSISAYASFTVVSPRVSIPRSSLVMIPSSPVQLFSRSSFHIAIMIPISRPKPGQTALKSSRDVRTYFEGLPVTSDQSASSFPVVVSSLEARTNRPGRVISGCFRTASAKTPMFFCGFPMALIGTSGSAGESWTYAPEVF